jgi:hypothetical protein
MVAGFLWRRGDRGLPLVLQYLEVSVPLISLLRTLFLLPLGWSVLSWEMGRDAALLVAALVWVNHPWAWRLRFPRTRAAGYALLGAGYFLPEALDLNHEGQPMMGLFLVVIVALVVLCWVQWRKERQAPPNGQEPCRSTT